MICFDGSNKIPLYSEHTGWLSFIPFLQRNNKFSASLVFCIRFRRHSPGNAMSKRIRTTTHLPFSECSETHLSKEWRFLLLLLLREKRAADKSTIIFHREWSSNNGNYTQDLIVVITCHHGQLTLDIMCKRRKKSRLKPHSSFIRGILFLASFFPLSLSLSLTLLALYMIQSGLILAIFTRSPINSSFRTCSYRFVFFSPQSWLLWSR